MSNHFKMRNDKPTICPRPPPKKLITNWSSRNDSSKVNAILQPDNYLPSQKQKFSTSISGNNCYCKNNKNKRKSRIPKPTFFKRPNGCVLTSEKGTKTEKDLVKRRSSRCVCCTSPSGDDDSRYRVDKAIKSSDLVHDVGLQKSDQRIKYEEYRREQEEIFREKLEDNEMEERYRRQLLMGAGDAGTVDTLLVTQTSTTKTSLSNEGLLQKPAQKKSIISQAKISDDIPTDEFPQFTESEWSIPEFRREHYFETHDVGKIANITGDNLMDSHTCVHQFRLDKRWLPSPVHQDAFGRSLCKICDKPMEGSCTNVKSSRGQTGSMFSGSSISKAELRSYANAYKEGFAPTTVNLGRGKSKIQVLLQDSDVSQLTSYINKVKKPQLYANSLALRHQKMRLS